MSNTIITERVRANDEKLIKKIYGESRGYFLHQIMAYSNKLNKSEALEFYQDAFYIMYTNIINGKELTSSITAYLVGIGKNLINSEYRRKQKLIYDFVNNNMYTDSFLDELNRRIANDTKEELVRLAVKALKDPCAKILTLLYWSKMNYKDILKKMPKYNSVDALKAQKRRCMIRFEKVLKDLFSRANIE